LRLKYIIIISAAISIAFSFARHSGDAVDNFFFHLGLNDAREKAAVEDAVLLYNKVSASFYSTAGDDLRDGIAVIPAAPLIKRRLVKDINVLKGDGLLMVFDRDSLDMRKVYFIHRNFAVAETDEVWGVALQDVHTRKPVFNVKAVVVKARYQFIKEKEKWVIYEVDVYPKDEDIPGVEAKPVL